MTTPKALKPKILYVSDSLGTPIHARGIYNYSVALVEMVVSFGFDVALLVERAKGFGVNREPFQGDPSVAGAAFDICDAADVYRYFASVEFHSPNRFSNHQLQKLADLQPERARTLFASLDKKSRNPALVLNDVQMVDFIPDRVGVHLKKFSHFLVMDRVYSDSVTRGFNAMPPVPIDASGFDCVVVDTPHNFKIEGVDPARIFSVVHDVIPLTDPLMVGEWRTMFMMKMTSTLANRGNLIFVSETTRSKFYQIFSKKGINSDLVVYPTIRSDLLSSSAVAGSRDQSDYLRRIAKNRPRERLEHLSQRAQRQGQKPDEALFKSSAYRAEFPEWNSALPYVTTTLSDEPRKNVRLLVDASKKLVGQVNVVIMGQINGNAYMNHEPENYPNLHFTGYVSESQKIDLLKHAKAIVFPSFSEGFGIPIVEGALFGVPLLCSDLPVFREITEGKARLFDPGNVDNFIEQLTIVLRDASYAKRAATDLLESVKNRFSQPVMRKRLRAALVAAGLPCFE